ncbi:hypothetical protein TNCV_3354061 [Trichonephila clavipes]|nr:hypothetical protein TNCV_3354061 [Trichonephila clavipes]
MTPELAPPLLTTTLHQREDVSALDRFSVHRCPTRRVFSAVSSQSLDSNGPIVDSRDLNSVFGHTEATHNKIFFSSPTKYTVESEPGPARAVLPQKWKRPPLSSKAKNYN